MGVSAVKGQHVFNDAIEATPTRRQFLQTLALGIGASVVAGRSAAAFSIGQPTAPPPARLPTAVVYDAISRLHVSRKTRPECPERYDAVVNALNRSKCFPSLRPYDAREATDREILACHTAKYLAEVRKEIEAGARRLSTGDTWVCREVAEGGPLCLRRCLCGG